MTCTRYPHGPGASSSAGTSTSAVRMFPWESVTLGSCATIVSFRVLAFETRTSLVWASMVRLLLSAPPALAAGGPTLGSEGLRRRCARLRIDLAGKGEVGGVDVEAARDGLTALGNRSRNLITHDRVRIGRGADERRFLDRRQDLLPDLLTAP